ncbi:MAG: hypothetical protein MJK04_15300 [Psychrosphaera sp.]|nr:hypothetical protein [Psychrosphaera sp.]
MKNNTQATNNTKVSFKLKTDLRAGGADGTVYSYDPENTPVNATPPPAQG